jgi:endonuclease YncB( thermonuclease family)
MLRLGRVIAAAGAVSLVVGASASAHPQRAASVVNATVRRVVDGDTIDTTAGRVRLLQIDTPEVYNEPECYGTAASAETERLLPAGTRVALASDPALDQRDSYGRRLAYVWKGSSMINLRLVVDGAAAPYFYRGERGRYARPILRAALAARAAHRGLWGACRHGKVPLRPNDNVDTGPAAPAPRSTARGGCDPNYAGACVPIVSGDLNCSDIRHKVRVVGKDHYHLDGDHDGWGCESYP